MWQVIRLLFVRLGPSIKGQIKSQTPSLHKIAYKGHHRKLCHVLFKTISTWLLIYAYNSWSETLFLMFFKLHVKLRKITFGHAGQTLPSSSSGTIQVKVSTLCLNSLYKDNALRLLYSPFWQFYVTLHALALHP